MMEQNEENKELEQENKEEQKANNENEDAKETEKNENEQKQDSQKDYDELNDRYMRVMAEFENFKKRSQKERETLYNSLLGDIILKILPVMDNLEIAMNAECKDENYKQGIELVQKQFKDFLEKLGVEEIPAVGEIFDPSVHEAISSVQDDSKESQEIVQEFRKGYKIGSKVIRHSMVIVNQ